MPHPWALPTALVFTAFGNILSIYTFASPLAAARMFGLDLGPHSGDQSSSGNKALRFVPVFGGRNLAIGLAIFAFYWQQMPRAMGTLLLCCTAAGIVDIVVTALWGIKGKAWTHAIGTVIMGLSGWGMMM